MDKKQSPKIKAKAMPIQKNQVPKIKAKAMPKMEEKKDIENSESGPPLYDKVKCLEEKKS